MQSDGTNPTRRPPEYPCRPAPAAAFTPDASVGFRIPRGPAHAQRYIDLGIELRSAMYSNLTPIIALMGGWLILGEQPALAQFAGVVLILSGIFIVPSMKPVLFLQEARVRMSGMVKQKAGRRFLWPWR
jgi:hypothetical protein